MTQRTVVIRTTPEGPLQRELGCDEAVQPGHLLELNSATTVAKLDATIWPSIKVAIESATVPVSATYAAGDMVPYVKPRRGDEVYLWLAAGETIAVNEVLQSKGSGQVGQQDPLTIAVAGTAVAATLVTGASGTVAASGTCNAVHFTAADAGRAGNGISVTLIDGTCDAGGISVVGNDITAEVDGTTIASALVTLLNANSSVAALVTAATLGANATGTVVATSGTLAGGVDVGEITSGGGDLQAAIRAVGLARALEAVTTTSAAAQIKCEIL